MRKCKNNLSLIHIYRSYYAFMKEQQMLQRPVQKRKDQGDFAVAFWKLRVTEQDRKKVTEIWEIILYAVKQIR